MSSPRISIVTVVFNRAATVGEALRSVQAQSYENVEHVVVDGASDDGTLEVVEAHRIPSMRVLSEPDEGIYDALNKGMALAEGDVIGVMHSDDSYADTDVLSEVAACFRDEAVDAVYGDLEYVAADDPGRVVRYWSAGDYSLQRLRRGWMPPHPTLFVRRSVVERLGGYDTSFRIAADYDAILRWFGRGGLRAAYLPRVLVRMRLGGESNASLRALLRKSSEDYRALRRNEVGGALALLLKNASKLPQFLDRRGMPRS